MYIDEARPVGGDKVKDRAWNGDVVCRNCILEHVKPTFNVKALYVFLVSCWYPLQNVQCHDRIPHYESSPS
jgi:hypothetical protein